MRKGSFGQYLAIFLVVIGVLYFIGAMSETNESKCIKVGCDNKQASGSSYCYIHKPDTSKYSSHSSSSYSGSNKSPSGSSTGSTSSSSSKSYSNKSNTTSNSSYGSSTKKSSTTKENTYDSYGEGYDDIFMNGDYDYDRYAEDDEYAEGVDDAMEESGEEWQIQNDQAIRI